MTDKELKRLTREELLVMLLSQSQDVERLTKELEEARESLKARELKIEEAGSIAEAALQLNGVFEAAQAAAQQYLENIEILRSKAHQEFLAERLESKSMERIKRMLEDTQRQCDEMRQSAQQRCQAELNYTSRQVKREWDRFPTRLESFGREHKEYQKMIRAFLDKEWKKIVAEASEVESDDFDRGRDEDES